MTRDKFQAADTAYQVAHGREAAQRAVATPVQRDVPTWSDQCLSVIVEDTHAEAAKMPACDDYIREHQLCSNCLRPEHPIKYCHSPTRCEICKWRYHNYVVRSGPEATTTDQLVSDMPDDTSALDDDNRHRCW